MPRFLEIDGYIVETLFMGVSFLGDSHCSAQIGPLVAINKSCICSYLRGESFANAC
jgi:hypothetical protein